VKSDCQVSLGWLAWKRIQDDFGLFDGSGITWPSSVQDGTDRRGRGNQQAFLVQTSGDRDRPAIQTASLITGEKDVAPSHGRPRTLEPPSSQPFLALEQTTRSLLPFDMNNHHDRTDGIDIPTQVGTMF